jgi:hypothetical protein
VRLGGPASDRAANHTEHLQSGLGSGHLPARPACFSIRRRVLASITEHDLGIPLGGNVLPARVGVRAATLPAAQVLPGAAEADHFGVFGLHPDDARIVEQDAAADAASWIEGAWQVAHERFTTRPGAAAIPRLDRRAPR